MRRSKGFIRSIKDRSATRRGKTRLTQLSRKLAFEPLEDRRLLAVDLTLLADIVTGAGSSSPNSFTVVGSKTYFTAFDPTHGREIWVTDGSPAGTHLVSNIGTSSNGADSNSLVNVGGKLFFTALDNGHGDELWALDATDQPYLVKDIRTGTDGSNISEMKALGNTLYLSAGDNPTNHNQELWKSDGTAAGTVIVKDINPGSESASSPSFLTPSGNFVYFRANDGVHGTELWRTDATDGAVLVKDVRVGSTASGESLLTDVGGTLFFAAFNGTNGNNQVYATNGTDAGTVQVLENRTVTSITNVNGKAFITAYNDFTQLQSLYMSNGTPAGTTLIKTFANSAAGTATGVGIGSTLYFTIDTNGIGNELWKSDGTAAGTVLVSDIISGAVSSSPQNLTNVWGTLYFSANDGSHGRELWRTDGTPTGTELAAELAAGSTSSFPIPFAGAAGSLFVAAQGDGVGVEAFTERSGPVLLTPPQLVKDIDTIDGKSDSHPRDFVQIGGTTYFAAYSDPYGAELWKTDGTEKGTTLVKDIAPGFSSSMYGDDVAENAMIAFNNKLYFAADDNVYGLELWRSDGTEAGTFLVKDIRPTFNTTGDPIGGSIGWMTVVGSSLFFTADDGSGMQLWKTDGTASGTVLVKTIYPGESPLYTHGATDLVNLNGTLYFSAEDVSNGRELWRSDGTAVGTMIVKDIAPGSSGSSVSDIVVFGNSIYFAASDGNSGKELWKSDGTEAGTSRVKDINVGPADSSPFALIATANGLFFVANDGITGGELWKSDGTESGTLRVKDINPSSASSIYAVQLSRFSGARLVEAGGTVYFAADDGTSGVELWKSDGTEPGTVRVANIAPGIVSSYPSKIVSRSSEIFFTAADASGYELWKSDGTGLGTVQVSDINPGSGGSLEFTVATQIITANGKLLFAATDGAHGEELWISDGTANGTNFLKDIDKLGSDPEVINVGNQLLMDASDSTHGDELWTSNGTSQGTRLIKDIWPGPESSGPFGSGGAHAGGIDHTDIRDVAVTNGSESYFFANDGTHGYELWKTDLTTEGTVLVKDIYPGPTGQDNFDFEYQLSMVIIGGTLYFPATDGQHGIELWKSDGTEAGTVMVKDLDPGAGDSKPYELTNVGGTLYFAADAAIAQGVWKSNGSEAGTVRLDGDQTAHDLTNVNGTIFYAHTYDGAIWKIDPVTNAPVKAVDVGSSDKTYSFLEAGGLLYFAKASYLGSNPYPLYDVGIWRTDGTQAGTAMTSIPTYQELAPEKLILSYPGSMASLNGQLFIELVYNDDDYGSELAKYDATANQVTVLKDIMPGPAGSRPSDFTVGDGVMYFIATDVEHGRELWVTDGTTAGTVLAADVTPGTGTGWLPSEFSEVAIAGGRPYFAATAPEYGRELWTVGGKISIGLIETDSTLGAAGNFRAYDRNATGAVTAQIMSVNVDGNAGALSNATLKNMLSIAPGQVVAAPSRVGERAWTFNSGGEAFNYLAAGEALTLDYVVRYTDNAGAFIEQRLVITIAGTAEPPVSATIGDYNQNNVADAGDYVLWRKAQGNSVPAYTSADGSGNGSVGPEDYGIWRTHFGQMVGGGAAAAAAVGDSQNLLTASAAEPSGEVALTSGSLQADSIDNDTLIDFDLWPANVVASSGAPSRFRALTTQPASTHVNDDALLAWLSSADVSGSQLVDAPTIMEQEALSQHADSADWDSLALQFKSALLDNASLE